MLLPKQVVICTPPACQQNLQQLQPIQFVAAFCSQVAREDAEQLWQQLGRAGPPLFLKVRVRDALQQLEQVKWVGGWETGSVEFRLLGRERYYSVVQVDQDSRALWGCKWQPWVTQQPERMLSSFGSSWAVLDRLYSSEYSAGAGRPAAG